MAENKKSVLLYCDIIHTVEELDDVDAGLLFKHYLRYVNDQNPEPPSKLIKIVFEPIKQNLKRDLVKWIKKSERNTQIAIAGWEKRKNANACERIKVDANYADIVTDKVTVKENDIFINTLGTGEKFFTVSKKYVTDKAYRVNGVDGLKEYMNANQSILNYPQFAEKFMRKYNGAQFNDFMHVFNSYNKFTDNA
jgi:hypothetical protein